MLMASFGSDSDPLERHPEKLWNHWYSDLHVKGLPDQLIKN